MDVAATSRRRFGDLVPPAVVVIAVVAMAFRESAGFTKFALFFDDAWAALPAHESVSNAIQMTVSTPLWTLAMRSWIRAGTFASWWAQTPAFIAAIVMGLAAYGLIRRFGFPRWPAALATVVLVTNPTTITYASRVKPYTVEMLLAILLVWCGEHLRTRRDTRSFVALAIVSVGAFAVSFAVVAVVIGVWLAVGAWCWRERDARRRFVMAGLVSSAGVLAIGVPFLVARPPTLGDNWVLRGFMGRYDGLHHFVHNVEDMFAGFVHFSLGAPTSRRFLSGALDTTTRLVALASILLVLVIICVTLRRRAWTGRPELLPVGFTLATAVVLAFADILPFGDGRTDEVLYPVLALSLAGALTWAWSHLRAGVAVPWRAAAAGLLVAAVGVSVYDAVTKDARYPQVDLKGLYSKLHHELLPGDVIVVPSYLSFSWAYADVTPWHVDLHAPYGWPQGFRVASNRSNVILPLTWTGPDPQLFHLQTTYRRVWYIGYELGAWNPYAPTTRIPANVPMYNYTRQQLNYRGWHTSWFPTYALNCYAEPLTWRASPSK